MLDWHSYQICSPLEKKSLLLLLSFYATFGDGDMGKLVIA